MDKHNSGAAVYALRLSLAFFLVGAALSNSSWAANPVRQAEPTYEEMLKRANQGDLSIDFRAFRLACLKAKRCDARGEDKDLIPMRAAMQSKKFDQATRIAEKLIAQGFVNLEAHTVCEQAYEAMNKPSQARLHHDVAGLLVRSILDTGDGKTKETAFEVIGTFEEYAIMQVLGFPQTSISQSVIPGKPHSYDVLKGADPASGAEVSVYFNIDAFFPPKGL
jgi:hypothetical protein